MQERTFSTDYNMGSPMWGMAACGKKKSCAKKKHENRQGINGQTAHRHHSHLPCLSCAEHGGGRQPEIEDTPYPHEYGVSYAAYTDTYFEYLSTGRPVPHVGSRRLSRSHVGDQLDHLERKNPCRIFLSTFYFGGPGSWRESVRNFSGQRGVA